MCCFRGKCWLVSMECPHVDEAATLSLEQIIKVQPNNWSCVGECAQCNRKLASAMASRDYIH